MKGSNSVIRISVWWWLLYRCCCCFCCCVVVILLLMLLLLLLLLWGNLLMWVMCYTASIWFMGCNFKLCCFLMVPVAVILCVRGFELCASVDTQYMNTPVMQYVMIHFYFTHTHTHSNLRLYWNCFLYNVNNIWLCFF